jgi:hypothetical protein
MLGSRAMRSAFLLIGLFVASVGSGACANKSLGAAADESRPESGAHAGDASASDADAAEHKADIDCDDLVGTPGGLVPRACVIEVPNGAVIEPKPDGTTVVSVAGKVVATYAPCPCHSGGPIGPVGGSPAPNVDDRASVASLCSQLEHELPARLEAARACDPHASGQCQKKVYDLLPCNNPCGIAVNDDTALSEAQRTWNALGCNSLGGYVCVAGCRLSTSGVCVAQDSGGGICDP